eukprot:TRINITY_DN4749_c2_g1_i1.p1 TRINITY_DN4749_c2_g1~~TRINITY_DN4749_c2_g1_i1.p1  ORF type:complete len:446 (+),score=117.91 TRINITY_DN4749_c2_g1_i1:230-1567(+)
MAPVSSSSVIPVPIILLGGNGSGKTSLVNRLFQEPFDEDESPTNEYGAVYRSKVVELNKHVFHFRVWDTSGHVVFKHLMPVYYSECRVALVTYCADDMTGASFHKAKCILDDLRDDPSRPRILCIVGTHMDMKGEEEKTQRASLPPGEQQLLRSACKEEVKAYADFNEFLFMETSAKTGENVLDLFALVASRSRDIALQRSQKGDDAARQSRPQTSDPTTTPAAHRSSAKSAPRGSATTANNGAGAGAGAGTGRSPSSPSSSNSLSSSQSNALFDDIGKQPMQRPSTTLPNLGRQHDQSSMSIANSRRQQQQQQQHQQEQQNPKQQQRQQLQRQQQQQQQQQRQQQQQQQQRQRQRQPQQASPIPSPSTSPGNSSKPLRPRWESDSAARKCRGCASDFSMFVRKHHCRNCGQVFCQRCTQSKSSIPSLQHYTPVRVCASCFEALR